MHALDSARWSTSEGNCILVLAFRSLVTIAAIGIGCVVELALSKLLEALIIKVDSCLRPGAQIRKILEAFVVAQPTIDVFVVVSCGNFLAFLP